MKLSCVTTVPYREDLLAERTFLKPFQAAGADDMTRKTLKDLRSRMAQVVADWTLWRNAWEAGIWNNAGIHCLWAAGRTGKWRYWAIIQPFSQSYHTTSVCLFQTRKFWPLAVTEKRSRTYLGNSNADPGCLSRIPDPDFYPSRIPDPKIATKKLVVIPFFVAINFTKLYIILFLKCWRKTIWQIFKEL